MFKPFLIFSVTLSLAACQRNAPAKFEASIPAPATDAPAPPPAPSSPALIVNLDRHGTLRLNQRELGTVGDFSQLRAELPKLFEARKKQGLQDARTVFVKSAGSVRYRDVQALLDELKSLGAAPIGLEIEDLGR